MRIPLLIAVLIQLFNQSFLYILLAETIPAIIDIYFQIDFVQCKKKVIVRKQSDPKKVT